VHSVRELCEPSPYPLFGVDKPDRLALARQPFLEDDRSAGLKHASHGDPRLSEVDDDAAPETFAVIVPLHPRANGFHDGRQADLLDRRGKVADIADCDHRGDRDAEFFRKRGCPGLVYRDIEGGIRGKGETDMAPELSSPRTQSLDRAVVCRHQHGR